MERVRPVLNQVNVIGGDLDASLAFYRRLGVEIPEERVWRTATGAHHVTAAEGEDERAGLDLDSTTFARVWNTGWRGRTDLAGRVVMGFSVASRQAVDDIYRDMTSAGYRGLQPPYDAFWGARYAIVEDPDGLAVGLMSPISAAHRSLPPQV
ncbi:MAG: VOC family protein [Reyranella sp.]|uniref:VOC family protein n=1 Tax=Reyranella sp. TaxID=1929291 RepID=UPI003D0FE318